jgi:hypothetical protein
MRVLKTDKLVKESTLSFSVQKSWLTIMRGQPSRQAVHKKLKANSGQVILEYILLLMIGVGVATFLTKQLVSRDPDAPGVITGTWSQINAAIGADIID